MQPSNAFTEAAGPAAAPPRGASAAVPSAPAAATEPAAESAAETPPRLNLRAPEYYLNRELTWLAFNRRVLAEAQDRRTPLLERVKFTAIVAATLDEFFMKRIGGLKQQVGAGLSSPPGDRPTP